MATGGRNDPRNMLKTVIPNRIFVGGISENTNEEDLRSLFSKFGNVKATKVIFDKAGISKGFGFVTFETEYEAQKIIQKAKHMDFMLKDRKLNINKAEKKQLFNRSLESNPGNGTIVWPMKSYPRSSEVSRESVYYPQTSWPLMMPQFYLQQQCYYPSTPQSSIPQYLYPVAPVDYYQSVSSIAGSDYSETSADSGESNKNRPQPTQVPAVPEYIRSVQPKQSDTQTSVDSKTTSGSAETTSNCAHSPSVPHLHFPVFAKTLNGVTVMAYPNSFVMGNPVVHLSESGNESDNMLTELGVLHSPMAPGSLTPPPTPLASVPRDYHTTSSMDILRKN